jgi:predicted TIM-barrel fold metal-dependent hydrolase
VDGYLALCEKYKIPAVFHCDRTGSNAAPEKIYAAGRRHPTVPIVLYHMGFLGPHDAAIAVAKAALTKGDAQLYLETSQADPQAVLQAIKELGSDRVLFGTDATYYGQEHYAKYEVLVARLKNELPAEDFAKVVRGNAEKLFRLRL